MKKLDDALGDFIVRVTCPCGASRHIEPEALARLVGRNATLAALATRMRRGGRGGEAEATRRRSLPVINENAAPKAALSHRAAVSARAGGGQV